MKFFYNSLIVLLLIFFITADLNATNPIVKTKLTEDYPLIMRTLKEYVIYIDAFVSNNTGCTLKYRGVDCRLPARHREEERCVRPCELFSLFFYF